MSGITKDEAEALVGGLQDTIKKQNAEITEVVQKAQEESKQLGTLVSDTNKKLTDVSADAKKTAEQMAELKARLQDIEQKGVKTIPQGGEQKSIGESFVESDEYKAAMGRKSFSVNSVQVGSFHKSSIINASGASQPLVQADRQPGIIAPAQRQLTIRNLIPSARTDSNMIEFARELVYTNNAGPQYDGGSPTAQTEGAVKPESGITFELATAAVITLAHWIPVSRQILSDAPALQSYINGRLSYGVKLEEEVEILNDDGTSGKLNGLWNQGTAFARSNSGYSSLDTLLAAYLQVLLSDYAPTGYVLNPIDWFNLQMMKDTTGRYLFTDPQSGASPRLWGLPALATNSFTQGRFMCGAFEQGAQIFDREDATVRIAEQHADLFVRNMVAVLAEERLALAVYRPAAFVKGSF